MYARQTFRAARPLSQTSRRNISLASFSPAAHPYLYGGVFAVIGGATAYGKLVGTSALPEDLQAEIAKQKRSQLEKSGSPEDVFRQDMVERFKQGKAGQPLTGEEEKRAKDVLQRAKDKAVGAKDAVVGKVSELGGGRKEAFTGGEQGFIDLKLEEVEDVNHNTKRFRFALPEEDMVSGLHVASAIVTKFKAEGDEKPTIRPYTPVSDEDAPGHLDLLIKKYPNGPMSTHLHSLQPGQTLSIKGPIPKYPWTPNKHTTIGLIAGGTGITPMYQLARSILSNPADRTSVTLVFANITDEDILLKQELRELENTYPQRFRAFYVLDKPPPDWTGGVGGRVSKDLLGTVLPSAKEENVKVFVCGPPGFYKAVSGTKKSMKDQGPVEGILKELGFSEEQVFKF